ncbi:hypothetical protein V6N13_030628 [Hibiscus sabdariffa]|uniref:Uncharacterized protein n=1 Tax=Hibiscus sabdariffa TaxID=183260 RepID=A0ABR2D7H2_9ROSI
MGIHNVLPNQLAQVLIAKNNNGGDPSNLDEDELTMPGSAPSFLLPKRNSFDPHHKNKNQTSWQIVFNKEEMFFCRHESFHRGPLFPYPTT